MDEKTAIEILERMGEDSEAYLDGWKAMPAQYEKRKAEVDAITHVLTQIKDLNEMLEQATDIILSNGTRFVTGAVVKGLPIDRWRTYFPRSDDTFPTALAAFKSLKEQSQPVEGEL